MKMITTFLLPIMLIIACSPDARNDSTLPVNAKASVEAKNLLRFLYDIQGKYTLSGQHNFLYEPEKYHHLVEEITGKIPVVWGCDFSFNVLGDSAFRFQHCGPANLIDMVDSFYHHQIPVSELRANMTKKAIEMWKRGHIITLMWHHCFPTEGDACEGSSVWAMENRPSAAEWDSLCTEGTRLNAAWRKQLDIILPYLTQLRDANVPILWRPYHEMNGVWFWWCNQPGEDGFIRLWRMMYDYFTNEKKLNNLIWVWNTNAPRDIPGDEAFPYIDFYPGNEYVDVLAADVYRKDYQQSHHDQLVRLGKEKPISLGEIGTVPAPETLAEQPYWTWFMVWGYFVKFRKNSEEDIKAIYNVPNVLTHDEVARNEDGWIVQMD